MFKINYLFLSVLISMADEWILMNESPYDVFGKAGVAVAEGAVFP